MRDRLIEIVKKSLVKNIDYTHRLAENITDDLLAEGVIVPPCKVGQTFYLARYGKVEEKVVQKIEISSNNSMYVFFDWRAGGYEFINSADFGKTAFLNKEEAEKELAERSENGK